MGEDLTHDVVIVGGGPVGMGLAIELGQRGVRVGIVERHPEPQPIPKGQNLTQRTMEHFRAWGCEDALRAARLLPSDYATGGMTFYGSLTGAYHQDFMRRELVREYYFTDAERLPQYATEAVLRRRAGQIAAVDVYPGRSATALIQDGEGVSVEISGVGEPGLVLRGRYAVGCDGSRSMVRAAAGIGQTLSDHDKRMVLLVFRSEALHDLLARFPDKSFYNVLHPDLDGYWQFFGRVDTDFTWFFHAPVPAGTTRENYDFTALLHRAAGAAFDVDLTHIGFWDLRFAHAETFRAGRVFVAGDAAHSHPPYGGYGINTGFEDARNLGWKLAAVLQGWGGAALLDSYDAERRAVFAATARDFIARFIADDRAFLRAHDPERDRAAFEAAWAARGKDAIEVRGFAPHYAGSPAVWGEERAASGASGGHEHKARVGHHLSPAVLAEGEAGFDALGAGFALIADEAGGEAVTGFVHAAAAMGVPLAVLTGQSGLVLVRPDNFVAWAGARAGDAAADDPAAILARAVSRRHP